MALSLEYIPGTKYTCGSRFCTHARMISLLITPPAQTTGRPGYSFCAAFVILTTVSATQSRQYLQTYSGVLPAASKPLHWFSSPERLHCIPFTLDLGCKAVATDPTPERAEIVGMEYARTVIQNEEHWVVRVPEEHIADIPPIGTELFAIPTHVCPTSALYPAVPVVENGKVTGWWKVAARDRRLTL